MKQQKPILHGRDHITGGADPIPGLLMDPGGDTLDDLILAAIPDGFWKLDESSGTVAADSSGFGLDMASTPSDIPPSWGEPAGPPGQQTADFDVMTGSGSSALGARVSRAWASISTDFTAGIWMNPNSHIASPVMGQGNPSRGGGPGWALYLSGPSSPADRPTVIAAGAGGVYALNPLAVGDWAFAATTYDASTGEWKLYVDGLLQGSTTGTFTPATSWPLWIGHDGVSGFSLQSCHCILSYGFLVNRTLSGAELLAMNESTTVVDRTGYVLTLDDTGTPSWQPVMIEVEY